MLDMKHVLDVSLGLVGDVPWHVTKFQQTANVFEKSHTLHDAGTRLFGDDVNTASNAKDNNQSPPRHDP